MKNETALITITAKSEIAGIIPTIFIIIHDMVQILHRSVSTLSSK